MSIKTLDIDALERLALALVGVPWVDESWDPAVGLDCWTVTWLLYDGAGITLPRNIWACKPLFQTVERPGVPGDVLYFEPPEALRPHLGVRLRGLKFIDCNWGGAGVSIHDLAQPPWRDCLQNVWRYRGPAPGSSPWQAPDHDTGPAPCCDTGAGPCCDTGAV